MRARSRSALALALLTLATPSLAQHRVYTLGAEAANGDDFGYAVADAGDVDLDGTPDVVVGARYHDAGGSNSGRVFVYSGRTGQVIWTRDGEYVNDWFGAAVDGLGDVNGDGHSDVIVGAPGWDFNGAWGSASGAVYVLSGKTGGQLVKFTLNETNAQMGYAVAGIGDITGDGLGDYAFAVPYRDWQGYTDNGYVAFYGGTSTFLFSRYGTEDGALFGYSVDGVRATGNQATSRMLVGAPRVDGSGIDRGQARLIDGFGNTVSFFAGASDHEWFGATVAGLGDVNGDGWADYGFGSPYRDILFVGTDAGLVQVFSGASTSFLFSIAGKGPFANMGLSLAGAGDFDGDGRDDVLAGAPNDDSVFNDGGEARLVSGTGGTLQSWYGGLNDHMGRSVSRAGDLNGDGFGDVILGANDAPNGTGEAYVHLAELATPWTYCTGKVNSQGCLPAVGVVGTPSLSVADDLWVAAYNVINQKSGICFWGFAPNNVPFKGGTMCVQAPVQRTPVQSSGGSAGPDDCTGNYFFHFSQAYMASKAIAPGQRVHAQFWSRDPSAPFTVGLTNAAAFDVVP